MCGIRVARKHPAELESRHRTLELVEIDLDDLHRVGIVVVSCELQQLVRVSQRNLEPADDIHNSLQSNALLSQRLRPLGVTPHIGVFQLAQDLL